MSYRCPMHPEVTSQKPGRCPKCGMKLVSQSNESKSQYADRESDKSYKPLIILLFLITLVSFTVSFQEPAERFIETFMIGFFLVFSGFKLMDLKGFAQGYSTYDLLAKRWFGYGYIYPFIELFFALTMILNVWTTVILWSEVIVMGFSGLGVALKLAKHEKFQCACLGTFLKVPLTKITLIEDFGMVALAFIILFV